ncbi:hypothetical protein TrRE_jg3897 [Triparma retinervis]|uniref:Uncharacterized protein n=1 Tax=Triparma retinervis TaxID=2557542 RepID=A0A9W7A0D2_9STRA|nr:hypothetical protein TrRE_jg3897 [Triparma retinervis]
MLDMEVVNRVEDGFEGEETLGIQSISIDKFADLITSPSHTTPCPITVVTSHLHPTSSSPSTISTRVPLDILTRCDYIVHVHTPPTSDPWAKINPETALGIVLSHVCQWMGMDEFESSGFKFQQGNNVGGSKSRGERRGGEEVEAEQRRKREEREQRREEAEVYLDGNFDGNLDGNLDGSFIDSSDY